MTNGSLIQDMCTYDLTKQGKIFWNQKIGLAYLRYIYSEAKQPDFNFIAQIIIIPPHIEA